MSVNGEILLMKTVFWDKDSNNSKYVYKNIRKSLIYNLARSIEFFLKCGNIKNNLNIIIGSSTYPNVLLFS